MSFSQFCANFLPLALCLLPIVYFFWRVLDIRRGYWRTLLMYAIWFLPVQAFIAVEPILHGGISAEARAGLTFVHVLTDAIVSIVIFKLISRAKWIKSVLAYCAMVLVLAAGAGLSRGIGGVFLNVAQTVGADAPLADAFFSVSVTSAVQCVLLFFAAQILGRFLKVHSVDVQWNAFAAVLGAQLIGMLLIGYNTFLVFGFAWRFYVAMTAYMLVGAVADIYLARAFRETVRSAELQHTLQLFRQQQSMQQEQYRAIDDELTAIRRTRHDYANTLETIDRLLADGHIDKAVALAASSRDALSQSVGRYTGHPVVDAVLYNKLRQAERRKISMELQLLLPMSLSVSDDDLLCVFSNLLDNAMEYCDTLPAEAERRVQVSAGLQDRLLALRVSNTYRGESFSLDAPRSSKPDAARHGLGLSFVRDIAARYHGTLLSRVEDGMLHISLLLNLPDEPK